MGLEVVVAQDEVAVGQDAAAVDQNAVVVDRDAVEVGQEEAEVVQEEAEVDQNAAEVDRDEAGVAVAVEVDQVLLEDHVQDHEVGRLSLKGVEKAQDQKAGAKVAQGTLIGRSQVCVQSFLIFC